VSVRLPSVSSITRLVLDKFMCSAGCVPTLLTLDMQIGGRVYDLIKTRNGLNWTCWDCRHIEADIRNFMRETNTEFAAVQSKFRKLYAKFLAMENYYKTLKVINESPKRKKQCYLSLFT